MVGMSQLASSLLSRLQGIVHNTAAGQRFLYSDIFQQSFNSINLSPQDRRLMDKTMKLMEGVVKQCQAQRLNLKNSPPFILDIIPDTITQLVTILTRDPNAIREVPFLELFIKNVQAKCKEVLKLFKSNSVYEDGSNERRNLTKLSLIFSHMLSELKAQFHEGEFVGEKFRLTKKEAESFWKHAFKAKTFVPWNEFIGELSQVQKMSENEKQMLKCTIDLTCNDYVTNFEFDVFTRLFYPWKTLIRNWQLLTRHPGFVAFLTYDEVKKKLDKYSDKPGSYVFRLSCTRLGQWAIGYVAPDGKIYQTIPQNKSLIQALHEGSREGFYLYPNGQADDVDLSNAFEPPPADRVKVTSEQHQIYCEMGTTFELCKICDDNEKNVKLEPCGHLLCSHCLSSWNVSKAGNTCPFCRYEIKGTSKIIIDKFRAPDQPPTPCAPAPPPEQDLINLNDLSLPSDCQPPTPLAPPPPLPPRRDSEAAMSLSNGTRLPTQQPPAPTSAPTTQRQAPNEAIYVNVMRQPPPTVVEVSYVNADIIHNLP